MKQLLRKFCLAAIMAGLAVFGKPSVAVAQDNGPGQGERMQRLERRLNELAERQDQILRRLSAQGNPQPAPGPGSQMQPGPNMPQTGLTPAPGPNRRNFRQPWPQGMPGPDMGRPHNGLRDLLGLMVIAGIICNILLAVWIFTDIRKRGEGSGIFIALALVAGIPTAIIYALVRIGDKKL